MSDHKITWLNMPGYKGETWNPIVGCSKISEGCDNCYAERMAVRLAAMKNHSYEFVVSDGKWNNTILQDWRKVFSIKWKAPRMIFVCSMGDLFHETGTNEFLCLVFETIKKCPQHLFIILTKRPQNALDFFRKNRGFENLPNVWLGVTAENQQRANERIPILLQIKAAKRFVSIEPMLGPVDLINFISTQVTHYEHQLDWVICGGETGPKARPMHPDWARSLRDQCKYAQVPFFFKQWGEWDYQFNLNACRYSEGKAIKTNDYAMVYLKIGHKAAGRLLDGVEYNEFPEVKK